jgi:glycosyltransferase involved in cell wall biosynthesis
MNVLMLTPAYPPSIGGVERHVSSVARELARDGHSVRVITWSATAVGPSTEDRIRVLRLPAPHRPRGWRLAHRWRQLAENRQWILQADIVHCHDDYLDYLPFRYRYPTKPAFVTFHGWEGQYPPSREAIWIRRLSCRLAHGSIAVGHYLAKWYGTASSHVTYGGVTPPASIISPPEVPADITFLGRLARDTGVVTLMEALAELKTEVSPLSVVVCGDGPLRAHLAELSQAAGLHVRFTGFVPDVEPYIAATRFVVASGYLSILETMVQRKPVFALYDNDLRRDYLLMMPHASEMMVVAASAGELAAQIRRFRSSPELASPLVERAYAWASDQTWQSVADTYLDLYRESGRDVQL